MHAPSIYDVQWIMHKHNLWISPKNNITSACLGNYRIKLFQFIVFGAVMKLYCVVILILSPEMVFT